MGTEQSIGAEGQNKLLEKLISELLWLHSCWVILAIGLQFETAVYSNVQNESISLRCCFAKDCVPSLDLSAVLCHV